MRCRTRIVKIYSWLSYVVFVLMNEYVVRLKAVGKLQALVYDIQMLEEGAGKRC